MHYLLPPKEKAEVVCIRASFLLSDQTEGIRNHCCTEALLALEASFSARLTDFFPSIGVATSAVFFPYLGLSVNDAVTYLGLGKGAMERLAIYPILMWAIGFGFYSSAHIEG